MIDEERWEQREHRRITCWPVVLVLALGGGLAAIPVFAPAAIAPAALMLAIGLAGPFAPAALFLAIGKARQLTTDAETRRRIAEGLINVGHSTPPLLALKDGT